MNVVNSELSDKLTVCPTACSSWHQRNIKSVLLVLCEGNPLVVGSYHKRPAMREAFLCHDVIIYHTTVTSWWVRWRLKSPASRLFTQTFIQAQINEHIKAPRHRVTGLCEGNSPVNCEFPAQMASNPENVSICHHAMSPPVGVVQQPPGSLEEENDVWFSSSLRGIRKYSIYSTVDQYPNQLHVTDGTHAGQLCWNTRKTR